MDEELETIVAAHALGFQASQEGQPGLGVFAGAQVPGQDVPPAVGPDAQRDEERRFRPGFLIRAARRRSSTPCRWVATW